MLGSKKRDFKTSDRAIRARLTIHKMLMETGLSSEEAFEKINSGAVDELVKAEINRLKNVLQR